MNVSHGKAIAVALASLLTVAGCGSDSEENTGEQSARIKCEGGNTCSGHSECASADGASACQGMNECKGQGWVYTDSQEECDDLKAQNMSG